MVDLAHVDLDHSRSQSPSISREPAESQDTVDTERAETPLAKQEDVPPDGGYGWVCVACGFFINA